MSYGNKENFGQKLARINQLLNPKGFSKSKGKSTQDESKFLGKFIEDSKIKVLWVLAFLGPIGFFKPFYISYKKVTSEKGNVLYYYCDITRAKAERIALVAFIMSIFYGIILFYFVQEYDAERLDRIYKEEKRISLTPDSNRPNVLFHT